MKKIIAQLGPSCRKNSRQRCDKILSADACGAGFRRFSMARQPADKSAARRDRLALIGSLKLSRYFLANSTNSLFRAAVARNSDCGLPAS
jgi:hypothetical protein